MSRRVLYVYLFVALIYGWVTFLSPVPAETLEQYDLTKLQADLLRLTIVVPLLAIWFAAFYGFDKFKRYARSIESSRDGRAFNHIANGLGVLAASLPVSSISSELSNYMTADSPDLVPATTIIRNYLAIAFAFVAFWLIYKGSAKLRTVGPRSRQHARHGEIVIIFTVFLAALYAFLIFQNPARQIPPGEAWRATYYLPDELILATIIPAYAYIWLLGFRSVLNIGAYASSVKGILYKQMLNLLARGLIGIILISIVLQLLVNFAALFRSLSLSPLLGIIYLLLAAMAVGYAYVAIGAKKLQKIEEV